MATPLTPHFSIEELTATSTGLPNIPDLEAIHHLRRLCADVLEPIRDVWGPLRITSGYRSPEVNAAVDGSSPTTAHVYGCAADIVPLRLIDADGDGDTDLFDVHPLCFQIARWMARSTIQFDQAIVEKKNGPGWLHVGICKPGRTMPRRELLTYLKGRTPPYLHMRIDPWP